MQEEVLDEPVVEAGRSWGIVTGFGEGTLVVAVEVEEVELVGGELRVQQRL